MLVTLVVPNSGGVVVSVRLFCYREAFLAYSGSVVLRPRRKSLPAAEEAGGLVV